MLPTHGTASPQLAQNWVLRSCSWLPTTSPQHPYVQLTGRLRACPHPLPALPRAAVKDWVNRWSPLCSEGPGCVMPFSVRTPFSPPTPSFETSSTGINHRTPTDLPLAPRTCPVGRRRTVGSPVPFLRSRPVPHDTSRLPLTSGTVWSGTVFLTVPGLSSEKSGCCWMDASITPHPHHPIIPRLGCWLLNNSLWRVMAAGWTDLSGKTLGLGSLV